MAADYFVTQSGAGALESDAPLVLVNNDGNNEGPARASKDSESTPNRVPVGRTAMNHGRFGMRSWLPSGRPSSILLIYSHPRLVNGNTLVELGYRVKGSSVMWLMETRTDGSRKKIEEETTFNLVISGRALRNW